MLEKGQEVMSFSCTPTLFGDAVSDNTCTCRVKGMALSPGGEFLFSVSSDGAMKAWKIAKSLVRSSHIPDECNGLKFHKGLVLCVQ